MSAASTNLSCQESAPRLRVMVVDDSRASLVALCSYVERDQRFVVVQTASGGFEALERARDCIPDVVVIDFEMPNLNGLEATKALLSEFPGLRVVVVSLHDYPELRRLCQQSGAEAFVPKAELGQALPAILQEIHARLAK